MKGRGYFRSNNVFSYRDHKSGLTYPCVFSIFAWNGVEVIVKSAEHIKPKYLIDEKGNKKAVVMDIKDYQNLMEFIEDLEDNRDLLKAEKKATGFTPYEKFRKVGGFF